MSDFTFNGISAASLGLGIERYPGIPMPRKKITALSIPGRSGELHIDEGGLENVVVRYEVWWKNPKIDNFNTSVHARKVTRWLYGAPVGARLEDTYNPGVFRTATFLAVWTSRTSWAGLAGWCWSLAAAPRNGSREPMRRV